jgi:hypothetical protein
VSLFPSLTCALFAAPLLYNKWVVGFAKLVVQTVAVVLYCTPAIKTHRVAIAPILGVSFVSNPIYNPGLLSKSEQVRFTV